jgi:hypothetical protein
MERQGAGQRKDAEDFLYSLFSILNPLFRLAAAGTTALRERKKSAKHVCSALVKFVNPVRSG